jgi:hypothetical protein
MSFLNMGQRGSPEVDLTIQQKRLMALTTWIFRAGILTFVLLGCLTFYFGETSPTVPDVESRKVQPFYDKVHGNYVYLTEFEYDGLTFTFLTCVGCVLFAILIDFKLKRSIKRSAQEQAEERR